jgi:cation:H+ antiporter
MAIILLILGLVLAAVGGELFVRGAIGSANLLRISAGVIGVTVAAFSTSSPELAVAVQSALKEKPKIAAGNLFGANMINVGLVLGLVLCLTPLQSKENLLRFHAATAFVAPLAILFLCLDGVLSRFDGIILIFGFFVWLFIVVMETLNERANHPAEDGPGPTPKQAVAFLISGLICLVAAGSVIVEGAESLGAWLGWSPFLVGATLVAIGTSMPEMATTFLSRYHGHDDIGLGTVFGSNIFNGLFILGCAAIIHPIEIPLFTALLGLGFGLITVTAAYPNATGNLPQSRAPVLLFAYALYLTIFLRFA